MGEVLWLALRARSPTLVAWLASGVDLGIGPLGGDVSIHQSRNFIWRHKVGRRLEAVPVYSSEKHDETLELLLHFSL